MAGTEEGIKEPQATFSACFGAAFIMLHPTQYAAMLAEKMQNHGATGWLVNTGWSGGRYAFSYYVCEIIKMLIFFFCLYSIESEIKLVRGSVKLQLWLRKSH